MGKGGGTPDYVKPDPVPAASPPATPDNADVQRAKQEQKKRAAKANGWRSTLLSGLGGGESKEDKNQVLG